MFKEIGQFATLMKQLPKMKAEMDRFQERIAQITGEGDAGGGMVKVVVNGKMQVISCKLGEDVFKQADKEMLEDLIIAALNQALERVRNQVTEETGKIAGDLGLTLPGGLKLPGMP